MQFVQKKLKVAAYVFEQRGFFGFFTYYLWKEVARVLGKWVELKGNTVILDNLVFFTDAPGIPTIAKGQMVQGEYERPERWAVKNFLDTSLPVIEFGAFIGVVSCITNKMLQHPSQHIVVEGNPQNLLILEKHRQKNQCSFEIMNRAVAYNQDFVHFSQNGLSSSVGSTGVTVQTTTLKEIIDQHQYSICSLICDIEGEEIELIQNEGLLFSSHIKTLIIEVHPFVLSQFQMSQMFERLNVLGFQQLAVKDNVYVFNNQHL